MENNRKIVIESLEDLETLHYFANLANIYEKSLFKNEYEMVISKRAYDIIPKIIAVRNGYVVLEDNTIRCSESCSWFTAQYDGCDERELHSGFNNAIKGY